MTARQGTAVKGNATRVFTLGHPTWFIWLLYSREGTMALKIKHEHQPEAGYDVSFRQRPDEIHRAGRVARKGFVLLVQHLGAGVRNIRHIYFTHLLE